MFEDSLFDSTHHTASRRSRWAIAGAAAIQVIALAAVILVPLLYPAVLPVVTAAPRPVQTVFFRPTPRPQVLTKPMLTSHPQPAATTYVKPSEPVAVLSRGGPTRVPTGLTPLTSDAPAVDGVGVLSMGGPGGGVLIGNGGSATSGNGPSVVARPAPVAAGPAKISSGVISGNLLAPIVPLYPRIAVAARVEGTVVLRATISKAGRIEDLQVLSGPAMLRASALDAVRDARYRPYLLNGSATEVETTISVNFRLAS